MGLLQNLGWTKDNNLAAACEEHVWNHGWKTQLIPASWLVLFFSVDICFLNKYCKTIWLIKLSVNLKEKSLPLFQCWLEAKDPRCWQKISQVLFVKVSIWLFIPEWSTFLRSDSWMLGIPPPYTPLPPHTHLLPSHSYSRALFSKGKRTFVFSPFFPFSGRFI